MLFNEQEPTHLPLCFCQLQLIMEKDNTMQIPAKQKMERQETLTRHREEYKAALQRAKTLDVPHAYTPPSEYGTFDEEEKEESTRRSQGESSNGSTTKSKVDESWGELIERLFDKDEHGHMVLKK